MLSVPEGYQSTCSEPPARLRRESHCLAVGRGEIDTVQSLSSKTSYSSTPQKDSDKKSPQHLPKVCQVGHSTDRRIIAQSPSLPYLAHSVTPSLTLLHLPSFPLPLNTPPPSPLLPSPTLLHLLHVIIKTWSVLFLWGWLDFPRFPLWFCESGFNLRTLSPSLLLFTKSTERSRGLTQPH